VLSDLLRQIVERHFVGAEEGHGPLDAIFELAHVAGPVVHDEPFGGGRVDAAHLLAAPRRETQDEVLGEEQDVARPLSERRRVDAHHVDPVEEVSRKRFASTSASRSRLVAVTIRASNAISSLPPTGRTLRSWRARSSFGCISSGSSPISSRNSVPRSLARRARCGRPWRR